MTRKRLQSGVYDVDGELHIDVGELLAANGYDDTPANRAAIQVAAERLGADRGLPVDIEISRDATS